MIALQPLLIPFILGLLVSRVLLRKSRMPHPLVFSLAIALPLGLALCSLILFWSYVLASAQAKILSILTAGSLILVFLGLNIKNGLLPEIRHWGQNLISKIRTLSDGFNPQKHALKDRLKYGLTLLGGILFLYLVFHYSRYFWGYVSWNIYGGWDAQFFWNLKAKFYFRDPAEWRGMFSHLLDWAHPDYPLLIPGAVAWGWNFTGKEFLLWPPVIDFVFFLSLCLLVVWYLGSHLAWSHGFLAGSFLITLPMYRFWSTTQYVDIALCFFFTASILVLLSALRTREATLYLYAGLLAGISTWTKNEGLFFIVWITLIFILALVLDRKINGSQKRKFIFCFVSGIMIAFSAALFAKFCLGLQGGEYLGSGRQAADYLSVLFFKNERAEVIAKSFLIFKLNHQQWNGLWILFLTAALFSGRRGYQNYRWIFIMTIFLIEFGYFVVLHWSPAEIRFQISVSLLRLMMHTGVLALIYTFEGLSPVWRPHENRDL